MAEAGRRRRQELVHGPREQADHAQPEPTLTELTAAHQWTRTGRMLTENEQRVFIPAGDPTELGEA